MMPNKTTINKLEVWNTRSSQQKYANLQKMDISFLKCLLKKKDLRQIIIEENKFFVQFIE